MVRTDEQKEVERLLGTLEDAAVLEHLDPAVRMAFQGVVKICRFQQEEIRELQDIPKNIGLGLRIIGYIGGIAMFFITSVGGVLAIRGYFSK